MAVVRCTGVVLAVTLTLTALCVKGEFIMRIAAERDSYCLAEPLIVTVTYENSSDSTIRMDKPEESLEVFMHLVSEDTQEDMNYSMGTPEVITPIPGEDEFVISEKPVDQIEIEPNSSHQFTSDVNERLYLHPGKFDCYLNDQNEESNHIELSIELTKDSVRRLLLIARDVDAGYSRREWAMDWLNKLNGKFKLKLPLDEDADSTKAGYETQNARVYDEFAHWWHELGSDEADSLLEKAKVEP